MMASAFTVVISVVVIVLFYSVVGAGLARWLKLDWVPTGSLNPVLGWGFFTTLTLPIQSLCGFTRITTVVLALIFILGALAAWFGLGRTQPQRAAALPAWAYVLAAAIAFIPLFALLPRTVDHGIIMGWTASDHSKVAMIDEMTRLGLPVGNPFFGWQGARGALSYYYLWHFGAAQAAILSGVTGWEADAAMTGFTAYASLLLMMGLAGRIDVIFARPERVAIEVRQETENHPPRGAAIFWVAILSLAGSLKPALSLILGHKRLDLYSANYRDLETWFAQASWVPQHLASACCVVVACLVLLDLVQKPRSSGVLALGVLAAAAFGSSAWVGGVTFPVMAAAIGFIGIVHAKGRRRLVFIGCTVLAAAIALLLASPLLRAEFNTLGNRHGSAPVAVHPFEVIGSLKPRFLRRLLDLPAFWLVLLPIDLPAIYPAGMAAFIGYVWRSMRARLLSMQILCLGVITAASLIVSWLLASTVGNNDLGWRAVLPAILILTPLAAAGLAHWIKMRSYAAAGTALALVAVSMPERTAVGDITGKQSDDASDFAEGPKLWKAVRKYAGPEDRVANNPLYLDDITAYPVNLSWALLSNRPSCYSGWETARAYVDLPAAGVKALDDQFIRIFAGKTQPDDLRQMAQNYGCRVVVVTDSDGAWTQDPFSTSPYYRLTEEADDWKIYLSASPDSKNTGQH